MSLGQRAVLKEGPRGRPLPPHRNSQGCGLLLHLEGWVSLPSWDVVSSES